MGHNPGSDRPSDNILGDDLVLCADYNKALTRYQHELIQQEASHTINSHRAIALACTHEKIANMQMILAQYADGMDSYKKALELRRANSAGGEDPSVAKCYAGLALILEKVGKYDDALKNFHKALEIYNNVQPVEESTMLSIANVYSEIGTMYTNTGSYPDALKVLNGAITKYKAIESQTYRFKPAEIWTQIGDVYLAAGQYTKAIEHYKEAINIRNINPSDELCFKLGSANTSLSMAKAQIECGKFIIAEADINDAMLVYKQIFDKNPQNMHVAKAQQLIAYLFFRKGDYRNALGSYMTSLDMLIDTFGVESNHPLIANAHENLGVMYQELGKYVLAQECNNSAFEIRRSAYVTFTMKHVDFAKGLDREGAVYCEQGKFYEALQNYQQALQLRELIYAKNATFNSGVARSHSLIAGVYTSLCEFEDAESHYRQSIDIQQSAIERLMEVPAGHADLLTDLCNMTNLYTLCYNFKNATTYHAKAKEVCNSLRLNTEVEYSEIYKSVAQIYIAQNNLEFALTNLEKAYNIDMVYFAGKHPDVPKSLASLAVVQGQMGNYDDALNKLQESIVLYDDIYGIHTQHEDIALSCERIGGIHVWRKHYREALEYHTKALVMYKSIHGCEAKHPDIARSYRSIGVAYTLEGVNLVSAHDYLTRSLYMFEHVYGEGAAHFDVAKTLDSLGQLYAHKMAFEKALRAFKKSMHVHEALLSHCPIRCAEIYSNIGTVFYKQKKYQDALQSYDIAYALRQLTQKDNAQISVETARDLSNYGQTYLKMGRHQQGYTMLRKALRFLEGSPRKSDVLLQAAVCFNVAVLAQHLKKDQSEIEMCYGNSREVYESLSPDQLELGAVYENLAIMEFEKCNYKKSLTLHSKSLDNRTHASLDENSIQIAIAHDYIGINQCKLGYYEKAYSSHKTAIGIKRKLPTSLNTNAEIAKSYRFLGIVSERLGKPDDSIDYHTISKLVFQCKCGDNQDPSDAIRASYNIGLALTIKRQNDHAFEHLNTALESLEKYNNNANYLSQPCKGWYDASLCMQYIGRYYHHCRKFKVAIKWFCNANKVLRLNTPRHPDTAFNHYLIGQSSRSQMLLSSALKDYQKALDVWKPFYTSHPDMATCYRAIGEIHEIQSRYDEATLNYQISYTMKREFYRDNHETFIAYHEDMANVSRKTGEWWKSLGHLLKALELKQKFYGTDASNRDIIETLKDIKDIYRFHEDETNMKAYKSKAEAMKEKIGDEQVSTLGRRRAVSYRQFCQMTSPPT